VRALISGVTTSGASTNVASTIAAIKPGGGAAATGQTFTLTTIDDLLVGTARNDTFNAVVDTATTSNTTYGANDSITDTLSTDADVLNISTNDDITAAPTIRGVETVNFNLNALTTAAGTPTAFNVAMTGITKGTAVTFTNAATTTAVDTLTITGDKGGVRTAATGFTTISSDTTADATFNVNAIGTTGTPVALTLGAAAGNVTVNASGNLKYTANTATGLLQVTAKGALTLDADAAITTIASTTGDLTVTDLDQSLAVTLTTTGGKIVATGDTLDAATRITATATKTVALKGDAVTDLTVSATGTTDSPSTFHNNSKNTLTAATLSGNGGALVMDMASGGTALKSLTTAGSQNVTAILSAASAENLATITKGNTGTFGIKLGTAAGSVDLSSIKLDSLELAVSNAAKTLTVANGQTVVVSIDQAGDGIIAGKAATDAVTLVLNDNLLNTAAADLTAIKVSSIGTLTIDASVDKTAGGAASTSALTKIVLNAGTDSTNVLVNTGANGATVGTITLTAGNTLTFTGSGDIGVADASLLTAGTLDASAVTGKVTLGAAEASGVVAAQVGTVKTGAGADTVYLKTLAEDLTLTGGAGNDTIYLNTNATKNLSIDGGDNTDTLVLKSAITLNAASGKTISLSNIESINYDSTGGVTSIDVGLLSGKSYLLKDVTAATPGTITTKLGTATSVDLSKLTSAVADASEIEGDSFVTDASSSTTLTSYIGANIAKNTYTGSTTTAATVVGGQFVDTFTVKAGMGTFTGGAGKDVYNLSAATGASATKFVTITDFAVQTGAGVQDSLKFTTAGTAGVNSGAGLTGWTNSANGIYTKADATVADFVTAAKAITYANHGDYVAAAFGSDVYIYSTGADKAVTTDDIMVKLTGVATLGVGIQDNANGTAGYISYVG